MLHGTWNDERPGTIPAAAAGLAAGIAGLGAAELIAGASSVLRSPVLDIGDRFIDNVPGWLKDLAIEWFGTNDKIALLVGIAIALAVFAAAVGVLALRRRNLIAALAAVAAFGAIGAWASVAGRVERSPVVALPSMLGAVVVAAVLVLLHRLAVSRSPMAHDEGSERHGADADAGVDASPASSPVSAAARRRFLAVTGAAVVAGGGAAATGRWVGGRFSASASRAATTLPPAADPLPPIPPAAEVELAGVSPFFTPNRDFYRIDTALTVPQVARDDWRLDVTGMVDRPLTLDYQALLNRPLVEADITMTCVSNPVGGSLVGTARWLGVPLDELLQEAGVDPSANQVVGRSVDGYTCGFPVSALDGRSALVAVGMNGEPLPLEHGFPARLIVAGLYGYVSATKWLEEIELTTFDRFDQYWVPRGYAAEAPIKPQTRIDTPRGLSSVAAGPVGVGGVAWAQTLGVAAVEIRVDDGPWVEADLAPAVNDATWRQWTYRWEATPGRHQLAARMIDETGAIQTGDRSEPLPDGASGWHQIVVLVKEP